MINTLFLGASEKRTVVGGNYNYVAKSLFPCSIRVLNKFGIEEDRFDNVTSGFQFKLPSESLYKLEVTNNIYAQDIKIYSGNFLVSNFSPILNKLRCFCFASGTASNYSFAHIKNLSKMSFRIFLEASGTLYHRIAFSDNTVFGTETGSNNFTDCLNNISSDFTIDKGYHSSYPSNTINLGGIRSDYGPYNKKYNVPANSSIICAVSSSGAELSLNPLIEY